MKKVKISVLLGILVMAQSIPAQQNKIKVIADQDSAGPQGTNLLSLLMLLRASQIELLGITTVSGDQWVKEATVFARWATEQAGRPDVRVYEGAEYPLLHTKHEQEILDSLYGHRVFGSFEEGFFVGWRGAFNPDAPGPDDVWPPPGGWPKVEAGPERAADFIVRTIRANPGEVVLYCAGPLTNIALAVREDPGIVDLTKAIYIMGGSISGGSELNWWWDPEAAAIVIREPWKSIVLSPVETGMRVKSTRQLMQKVVDAGGPLAQYIRRFYLDYQVPPGTQLSSAMWDEVLAASLVDPSVITSSKTAYLDVDIEHGPKYGDTIVWSQPQVSNFFLPYSGPSGPDEMRWQSYLLPPQHLHPITVQLQVDSKRFEEIFVNVMSH